MFILTVDHILTHNFPQDHEKELAPPRKTTDFIFNNILQITYPSTVQIIKSFKQRCLLLIYYFHVLCFWKKTVKIELFVSPNLICVSWFYTTEKYYRKNTLLNFNMNIRIKIYNMNCHILITNVIKFTYDFFFQKLSSNFICYITN